MLSESEISFYKENGYITLKDIFSEGEIEECSEEYNLLFNLKSKSNLEATWKGNWNEQKEKSSVLSIHNLQCHSAAFTRMLLNPKLLDIVSDLIGSQNILLHHTKAHVKPPSIGSPFPTHQDYQYFPYKKDTMVAVFIHLDDTDVTNGALGVFPSSHLLGPLENKSDTESHFYVDQEKFPLSLAKEVVCQKGDVVIFSYLLVHGSYTNVSQRNRRMLLFQWKHCMDNAIHLMQMVAAEDESLKEVHKSPCHGMVLKGRNVMRDADINKRHET